MLKSGFEYVNIYLSGTSTPFLQYSMVTLMTIAQPVVYQSLLEFVNQISNPFGSDWIDLPKLFMQDGLAKSLAVLTASEAVSEWHRDPKAKMEPSGFEGMADVGSNLEQLGRGVSPMNLTRGKSPLPGFLGGGGGSRGEASPSTTTTKKEKKGFSPTNFLGGGGGGGGRSSKAKDDSSRLAAVDELEGGMGSGSGSEASAATGDMLEAAGAAREAADILEAAAAGRKQQKKGEDKQRELGKSLPGTPRVDVDSLRPGAPSDEKRAALQRESERMSGELREMLTELKETEESIRERHQEPPVRGD